MPKKRFNIWMDDSLIEEIKVAATAMGLKVSTFVRVATLEKLRKTHNGSGQDRKR